MKFVKDEDEERRDYIFQKDAKTNVGARFIIVTLIILIIAVAISGLYFEWY
ncbi:MAG: hypothetical protein HKN40_06400 [Winogradskyella sp.]|uniref:hypothetical protein n=1 Tax=Winogradskyella sp. TaxID=1883156 RepID=UPI001806430C|nr:hypothetical protein [Winogradskyella sp.]